MGTTRSVLEKGGTFPYIDLAHAVLDQLDDVNIPDVMNSQYRNFVRIQRWLDSVVWSEEFEKIVNAAKPLDQVMVALFCTSQGDFAVSEVIKQIIRNIRSESLDESLDRNIKIFFNILPSALRKLVKGLMDKFDLRFDMDQWLRPFHVTSLLKRNKGALARVLHYELDIKYDGYNQLEFVVLGAIGPIVTMPLGMLVYDSADPESSTPILVKISEHLFKGITLTAEEEKIVLEPIRHFGKSILDLACNFGQKAFKSMEIEC